MIEDIDPFALIPTHRPTMSASAFARFRLRVAAAGRIGRPLHYVEPEGRKYIVDGHHRARAAKELGFATVPAVRVTLPHLGYRGIEDLLGGR
jgi:ParB-like chromosome segregation protein Spo0J